MIRKLSIFSAAFALPLPIALPCILIVLLIFHGKWLTESLEEIAWFNVIFILFDRRNIFIDLDPIEKSALRE